MEKAKAQVAASEAAVMLGKSRRRINQYVKDGDLEGQLIGNSNVITLASVLKLKKRLSKAKNGKGSKK